MNVASLELCKELYELSGKKWLMPGTPFYSWTDENDSFICPKYDLGYLLRKLPKNCDIFRSETCCASYYPNPGEPIEGHADTPEDAACKLAIELIKQGVLTLTENK